MTGEIVKGQELSGYQPPADVVELTKNVRRDFVEGQRILNQSWPELNNYSVIERMNKDQRTFQSFVDESVDDPGEAWKWRGTRSLARKKAWAMHAHLTQNYAVPGVYPQNSSQDNDVAMASALRDIVEWETVNSDYRPAYLLATQGMLVNPVTFLQIDYNESDQTIKDPETGEWQEITDDIISGVNCRVLSADQVLLTNVYIQNIQRQRAILKTRWIEYDVAQAKYGEHKNWGFLQPGVSVVFNDEDGLFYGVVDAYHPTLVLETTWENRREDSEICFLNGIYFGDDDVDWNPIKHRDNRNAPKYDIAPFGYHRVNEHFFYYASLMFEVGWDDKLIDAMYAVTMNREFLDQEVPLLFTGVDKVDSDVVFPGASLATPNKDAKATPLIPPRQGTPYQAMKDVEDSMSEASVSSLLMGDLPTTGQRAFTIQAASANAKIILGGTLRSLAYSIQQVGELLVDIALQHLTAPEIDEITNGLKYREFVLQDQMVGGKKVSKKIRFDEALMGRTMTETDKKMYGMKLLEESGYPDNKQAIYVLNPHLFSKMKYLVRIEVEDMQPKSQEFERTMMERMYTLLRQDPYIDPQTLVRRLIYANSPQDVDALMAKNPQDNMQNAIGKVMGQGQNTSLPGLPTAALSKP